VRSHARVFAAGLRRHSEAALHEIRAGSEVGAVTTR